MAPMSDILGIIIAIVVTAVAFWLLNLILPVWIAAVIALLLFLALVFGGDRLGARRRY